MSNLPSVRLSLSFSFDNYQRSPAHRTRFLLLGNLDDKQLFQS